MKMFYTNQFIGHKIQYTLSGMYIHVQIVNGHLNFHTAPIVPRNLSRSLRNTSTLDLERPVTSTNAHQSWFFPAYNHPMEQLTSICTKLPVIVFCYVLPHLTHNILIGLLSGCIIKLAIAIYVPLNCCKIVIKKKMLTKMLCIFKN